MYDYMAEGALPDNEAIKRAFVITEEKLKKYTRIQVALSGGSDSDTIAAITGSIAGVFYDVPKKFYEK